MTKRKRTSSFSVAVYGNRMSKAVRDKQTGILRYSAAHEDLNVHLLASYPADGTYDGVICLNDPGFDICDVARQVVDIDLNRAADSIYIDNAAIGKAAAQVLTRQGFASFAALGTTGEDTPHAEIRIAAFREALAKAGFSAAVFHPSADADLPRWVAALTKPCGIFAFCDSVAIDVLNACRLVHLKVPEQVSIIGVDNDTSICEVALPALSSIAPDFEKSGYLAAKLLHDRLLGRRSSVTRSYGIADIFIRDSIRSLSASSRLVTEAQALIRRRDCRSVADIAHRLNVSTALLNLRFREILGHGPKTEVDAVRLREIKSLLHDSGLSVSEVAYRCGFAAPEELHRFFKRKTGSTPNAWRRS